MPSPMHAAGASAQGRHPHGSPNQERRAAFTVERRIQMLKILGWIILIIFVIGLLVVFGVLDAIF